MLIAILVAEFGFVLWLQGMTIREYLRTRDPISGTTYVSLTEFSIMPIVVERTNLTGEAIWTSGMIVPYLVLLLRVFL